MPKSKMSHINFLYKMLDMYPGILKVEENQLFCNFCCCRVNSTKKFNVQQHMNSIKHKTAVSSGVVPQSKTITIKASSTKSGNSFQKDLCKALLKSNIPINKIRTPIFKGFVQKYSALGSEHEPICKIEAESDNNSGDECPAPAPANNHEYEQPNRLGYEAASDNSGDEGPAPAPAHNDGYEEPIAKKIILGYDPLNEPTLSTKQRQQNRAVFRNAIPDPLNESYAKIKEDNLERALRKRKLLLEIEQLQIQNYDMKLKLWEKEQQLQMTCSRFTKDFAERRREDDDHY